MELSETCADENPYNLITDCHVETNIVSDVKIIKDRISTIQENTCCEDIYVDGGFNSKEASEAAGVAGVELHLTNMSGNRPSKKLPVELYEIDDDTYQIKKCPAGNASVRVSNANSQTVAHFVLNTCERCELRDQCHIKFQKKEAVLYLSLKSIRTGWERVKMNASWSENSSKRAAIERSNSSLKRNGLKKQKFVELRSVAWWVS